MATGSRHLFNNLIKKERGCDMDVRVDKRDIMTQRPGISNRTKLKLLVLEADEQMMDRIIEAIEFVCGSDSEIRQ